MIVISLVSDKSLIAKQVASPKELSASTTEPDNVKPNIPVSEPSEWTIILGQDLVSFKRVKN